MLCYFYLTARSIGPILIALAPRISRGPTSRKDDHEKLFSCAFSRTGNHPTCITSRPHRQT
jgi:hypothetical protein